MKEILSNNWDIIVAIVVTAILTLIPIRVYIKHKYDVTFAKTQALYKNTLDSIKMNTDLIYEECNNIYSIPRMKGRNDSRRSAIRRMKIYLDMISSDIMQREKNGE